jgi:hypothetical protein
VRLVPRLASPVGFLLALLFFLLPFVAVSCEAPGLGSAEISYTGVDLATGGEPTVKTEGDLTSELGAPVPKKDTAPDPGGQLLAIVTVALLVIGLGVSLVPVARTRLLGAVSTAVAGGTLLIITEASVQSNLITALTDAARKEASTNPDGNPLNINMTSGIFDNMVQSRVGFWLSLIAIILVLLFNAGVLLWPRIRAATRQPAPATGPPVDPAAAPPVAEPVVEPEGDPPPPQ